MSSTEINSYDSYTIQNYKNYISNKSKLSVKTSSEKLECNKPKKININKFLTKFICYEQKKNFNLEKKRFQKLMEQQNLLTEKPNITSKSVGKNNLYKKRLLYLKSSEKNNIENKKNSNFKKNHTIEGDKINKLSEIKKKIKSKYNQRNLKTIQINKFCNSQTIKKNNENKKENKKQNEKIIKGYSNSQLNNKNNKRINHKAKYKHDKIIFRNYKDKDLLNFKKKTYLENKYSYRFQPIINYNKKYRKISSKYKIINKKYINKNHHYNTYDNRMNSKNYKININSNNSSKLNSSLNNIDIKSDIKIKNRNNKNSKKREINNIKSGLKFIDIKHDLKNKNQNNKKLKIINNSCEEKSWITILDKINKYKSFRDDNTYHLNINESTSCNENVVNNVPYKIKFKSIINHFIK